MLQGQQLTTQMALIMGEHHGVEGFGTRLGANGGHA
jgi:hypothetical protein